MFTVVEYMLIRSHSISYNTFYNWLINHNLMAKMADTGTNIEVDLHHADLQMGLR